MYRFTATEKRTTVSISMPRFTPRRSFGLFRSGLRRILPVFVSVMRWYWGRSPRFLRSVRVLPAYDSETRRRIATFFLPRRRWRLRRSMTFSRYAGSYRRCRLFLGAVLLGSSAGNFPCASLSTWFHRYSVRLETPKASLVAFSPCSDQNPSI